MARIDEELAAFLGRGVAVVVATRDRELRPALSRGWGPRPGADAERLALCVEAPPGSAMRANLEDNGVLAATFSLPTTYRTVQLKGEALEVREPSAQELEAVERHVEAFSREAHALGLPPASGRRLRDRRLVAVVLGVRELYDQTPGPNAGAPL